MNVLAINGSPHAEGNTAEALGLMAAELKKEGIDCEIITLNAAKMRGCVGCGTCGSRDGNWCFIEGDGLNEIAKKARDADGLILGAPTYYGGIAGHMKSFLDRLFYTSSKYLRHKVGACVSIARRAGAVDTVHQLNNYFNLAEMVIAPSQYWQGVYGMKPGEIAKDAEGVQTVQRNARAMAWLLKSLDAAKTAGIPFPANDDPRARTNFIR
jgi:multimeric flavodoxin WrbA